MEVHLTPEVEKKLNELAARRGRPADQLAQDVLSGYVDEMTQAGDFHRVQEAAAHILELQKRVKPDPEGWTVKDYINYGRP